MAITLASNFDQTAAVPLDSRTVVADSTARDAIASGVRYEGLTVYVVADAKNYQLIGGIANGDWTELQGAGGGGINYILTPDGADITGWATYADSGATPTDGTGGSPASTFAVSTDSSLVGTENFLWTKSAADRQGEGFKYDFTIDSAFKSKPMTISAIYRVDSGTYADNDMTVWVLDVTNSVLIQPSAYQIKNTTGVETLKCEFQAASNSTSYRLIFHTASTSALAYALRFDSLSVSPNTYNSGAVVTEPVAYTPTFTGFGTVSAVNVRSWRSGGHLIVQGTFTAGTPTATEGRITLGFGGVNAAVTSASTLPTVQAVGNWFINTNGAATDSVLIEASVGYLTFGHGYSSGSPLSKALGNGIVGTGSIMSFYASVPIAGWGTAQVLSSETDTREIAAIITGNPASATVGNPIIVPTVVYDSHGSYNATTGRYTCSTAGTFKMFGALSSASAATTLTAYKNAASYALAGNLDSNGEGTFAVSVRCIAGDIIDIRPGGTVDATDMTLNIERLSGPAQIAASEKVYLKYTGNAGGAITANVTNVDFTTKVVDSHGSWSGTTFTAPRPSWYDVNGSWNCTTGAAKDLQMYINGSAKEFVSYNTTGSASSFIMFSGGAFMNAGDTMTLRSDTSATLSNSATLHWLSIRSQG